MMKFRNEWRRVREEQPKRCPFCGGAGIIEKSPCVGLYAVKCSSCRAHSPFRMFAAEAVAAWNWRFGESETEGETR